MKKRVRLKKSVKSSLKLIVAIILTMASLFIIFTSFNKDIESKNVVTTLEEEGNLNYQVYLKKNDYFNVPYLGKDERYIAALIDKINIQYQYQLSSSKNLNYNYQYRVVATLDATQDIKNENKKRVWSKQFILKPSTQKNIINQNKIIVKDEIVIDYATYSSLVNQFKDTYTLALDANLRVNIYIDTVGKLDSYDQDINKKAVMSLIIPMNKQTIEITEDYKLSRSEKIVKDENLGLIKNKPLFILGCFLFATSTLVFVFYGMELLLNSREQFSYSKEKKRILNKYNSIIVNANRIPEIKGLHLIEVSSFEELIDAEEEFRIPIIFVEVIPGAVGWFVIIHQNQVWRYVLKATKK